MRANGGQRLATVTVRETIRRRANPRVDNCLRPNFRHHLLSRCVCVSHLDRDFGAKRETIAGTGHETRVTRLPRVITISRRCVLCLLLSFCNHVSVCLLISGVRCVRRDRPVDHFCSRRSILAHTHTRLRLWSQGMASRREDYARGTRCCPASYLPAEERGDKKHVKKMRQGCSGQRHNT